MPIDRSNDETSVEDGSASQPLPWYRRLLRRGRTVEREGTDLASIYGQAAGQGLESRNPLIVIPGIMGSRLINDQASRFLWGDFRADAVDPGAASSPHAIGLPMQLGTPLDQLIGTLRTDGSLAEVRGTFAGIPLRKRIYGDVLGALGVAGYAGDGIGQSRDAQGDGSAAMAFEFDYDWRRSLDETAIRFQQFIVQVTRFLRSQSGTTAPIRFDVVAHSMGGLMLRYFLQYGDQLLAYDGSLPRATWAGAVSIENAIVVGTPNAGSLFALQRLVGGLGSNIVHATYHPMILGTMPANYQLLPRPRHRAFRVANEEQVPNIYDIGLWVRMGWGLADFSHQRELAELLPGNDSAGEREDIALDHLDKCLKSAKALHQALDEVPPGKPAHFRLHMIAGDSKPTPSQAVAIPGDRTIRFEKEGPGDGIMLRSSALMDERVGRAWRPRVETPIDWESVTFVPGDHIEITRDPVALDKMLYLLLERPRASVGRA